MGQIDREKVRGTNTDTGREARFSNTAYKCLKAKEAAHGGPLFAFHGSSSKAPCPPERWTIKMPYTAVNLLLLSLLLAVYGFEGGTQWHVYTAQGLSILCLILSIYAALAGLIRKPGMTWRHPRS